MTDLDILQSLRMTYLWPVLVGCNVYYMIRLLFWVFSRRGTLTRVESLTAAGIALAAAAVVWMMAATWDGSRAYWEAFTVGMAAMAVVNVMTVTWLVTQDWSNHG